jgi:hypothetical protein
LYALRFSPRSVVWQELAGLPAKISYLQLGKFFVMSQVSRVQEPLQFFNFLPPPLIIAKARDTNQWHTQDVTLKYKL